MIYPDAYFAALDDADHYTRLALSCRTVYSDDADYDSPASDGSGITPRDMANYFRSCAAMALCDARRIRLLVRDGRFSTVEMV